jgi:hypothetical protein
MHRAFFISVLFIFSLLANVKGYAQKQISTVSIDCFGEVMQYDSNPVIIDTVTRAMKMKSLHTATNFLFLPDLFLSTFIKNIWTMVILSVDLVAQTDAPQADHQVHLSNGICHFRIRCHAFSKEDPLCAFMQETFIIFIEGNKTYVLPGSRLW